MSKSKLRFLVVVGLVLAALASIKITHTYKKQTLQPIPVSTVPLIRTAVPIVDRQFVAALDVAKVFGRSPGCTDADPKLITAVASEAIKVNLDPRVLAATLAVESGCNQFAVSNRGAIGYMQVRVSAWKGTYDFEREFNLLNGSDNIHIGATILASLVHQYGQIKGLRRYNGLGTDCSTCDAVYPDKIAVLAARE